LRGGSNKLDGIAGRVVEEDLLAAEPGHDVVAKARPSFAQRRDLVFEIVDLELDAVPTARLRLASIRHRLRGPARSTRCIKQKSQIAPREDGKAGRGPRSDGETEVLGVEIDCRIHVVYEIAHADSGHGFCSLDRFTLG
jgi:hypothetical protein